MNAGIHFKTEVRGLFGLWIMVVLAGIVQWLPHSGADPNPVRIMIQIVGTFGFGLGIPMLALLPFGSEFQFGTMASLLSQPIDRRKIWNMKVLVASGAVVSAALPYGLAWREGDANMLLVAFAGVIALAGSGVFWTLHTGSLIGGLTGSVAQAFLFFLVPMAIVSLSAPPRSSENGIHSVILIGSAAVVVCAPFMLWLGRRKLIQLQMNGPGAAGSLSANPPEALGRAMRGLLRCRPSNVWLNLVRKELSLLWPLALLTLLAVVCLLLLTPLRFSTARAVANGLASGLPSQLIDISVGVVVFYAGLVSILAGCLAVGLERESGTHSWHMILPVSVRAQWAIKLLTALASTLFCTALAGLLAAFLLGPSFIAELGDAPGVFFAIYLAVSVFITFTMFWCATAARGPIQAVLWLGPAIGAVMTPYLVGKRFGRGFLNYTSLLDGILSRVHPFPLSDTAPSSLLRFATSDLFPALLLGIPLLLVGTQQSYRLFREEPGRIFPVVRRLLVLAAVALVAGIANQMPSAIANRVHLTAITVFRETAVAVKAMKLDPEKLKTQGPLEISPETLGKTRPLSPTTQSWLGNAPISITLGPTTTVYRVRPETLAEIMRNEPRHFVPVNYFITVRFGGGLACKFDEHPEHSFFYSCTSGAAARKKGER